MSIGEMQPVTDPREIAEMYAREWESWADAIRRHPEVVQFGRPGHPEFDLALDAAIDLDEGDVDAELDKLEAGDFGDDEQDEA
jgi:hypothetical protein